MKTPFQAQNLAQAPAQNVIINGGLDFWQRGTSFAAIATGTYFADRLRYDKVGTAVHTVSRSTDVPTIAQSGFQSSYSALSTVTTAQSSIGTSDYVLEQYVVEGLDYATLHARPMRLQFWVKNSIVGTYSVSFRNSAQNRSYVSSYTINVANTWERKVIDLTADASGTWLFDNSRGLYVTFAIATGTTFQTAAGSWQAGQFFAVTGQTNGVATNGATFQIAQIQLMSGQFNNGVSMAFSRAGRTIQEELAMCQRYYEKSYLVDVTPGASSNPGTNQGVDLVNNGNTLTLGRFVSFRVEKRATATVVPYNIVGTINQWSYQDQAASGNVGVTSAFVGSSGFNVYFPTYSSAANRSLQTYGHWTAEAEL